MELSITLFLSAATVAISFYAQRQARDNVNHSAHLWGGAWGIAFMVWLEPQVLQRFFSALLTPFA